MVVIIGKIWENKHNHLKQTQEVLCKWHAMPAAAGAATAPVALELGRSDSTVCYI